MNAPETDHVSTKDDYYYEVISIVIDFINTSKISITYFSGFFLITSSSIVFGVRLNKKKNHDCIFARPGLSHEK